MQTRLLTLLAGLVLMAGFAQAALGQVSLTAGPSPAEASSKTPDKAYMQKIWDGWATLDPANVAGYYADGPHVFFDIAPLKYGSWDEYDAGVKKVLAGYKSAKCTVNDDAVVHPHGDLAWGTATINYEMTAKTGKIEMGAFRWTVIWEKQDGKWLIVHEHVSEPLQ
ncbi:MAG TPA: nuclear transport factor 2 family protein [Terriglobales bacterium]|nr:nuclear transport factor 2 family protein [Terriglobales bacterium]